MADRAPRSRNKGSKMVRVLGILVGLVFAFASLWSFGHGAYAYLSSPN